MTYELAKELKEAGFPQTSTQSRRIWLHVAKRKILDQKTKKYWNRPDQWKLVFCKPDAPLFVNNEWYASPTLEELIEACGAKFYRLIRRLNNTGWVASPKNAGVGEQTGKTPTEAVSKLWLALQKQ